ncbi:MAG: HAD family acid phosphatase [Woeseia sp.]
MTLRSMFILFLCPVLPACSESTGSHTPDEDFGFLWVNNAAEFEAVALQVYKQAELALPRFIEDKSWSALPGQEAAEDLPPAVIFDVDETVVSNRKYQVARYPHSDRKLYDWSLSQPADPIPGFKAFADAARAAGVTLFFVTNKPCFDIEGLDDPCPYETAAIEEIRETGVETDASHVMLAGERDGWGKEKLVRREHVALTHRIVMLIGDDLSDFIPCVRAKPAGPCTTAAGADERKRLTHEHGEYWGNGWYILPNPMHGSWTRAK